MALLWGAVEPLENGARLVGQVTKGGPWKAAAWPLPYLWLCFLCFLAYRHVRGLCEALSISATERGAHTTNSSLCS